jgi:hypothetical protein
VGLPILIVYAGLKASRRDEVRAHDAG